jgi:predicted nucleic acid-binding protein
VSDTVVLPDTNAFSSHLRGRDATLSARMTKAVEDGNLRLSLVVVFELRYGAEKALLGSEKRPAERVAKLERAVPVEPNLRVRVDVPARAAHAPRSDAHGRQQTPARGASGCSGPVCQEVVRARPHPRRSAGVPPRGKCRKESPEFVSLAPGRAGSSG